MYPLWSIPSEIEMETVLSVETTIFFLCQDFLNRDFSTEIWLHQDFQRDCRDFQDLLRFVETFQDLSRFLNIIVTFAGTSGSKILTN